MGLVHTIVRLWHVLLAPWPVQDYCRFHQTLCLSTSTAASPMPGHELITLPVLADRPLSTCTALHLLGKLWPEHRPNHLRRLTYVPSRMPNHCTRLNSVELEHSTHTQHPDAEQHGCASRGFCPLVVGSLAQQSVPTTSDCWGDPAQRATLPHRALSSSPLRISSQRPSWKRSAPS